MDDIDIWRSAHLLIKQHADQAGAVAADKVAEFQRAGDGDGMTVWVAIMQAIWELTEARPSASEPLN